MNKVVFCQASTDLIRPDNPCLDYYRKVYPKSDGYHMGEHFMEVPTWIAVISGMLPDEHYDKSLHIITDVQETIKYFHEQDDMTIVMFSVLEVNKHIVQDVIKNIPQVIVCGGYVNPDEVSGFVIWCDEVADLAKYLPHVQVDAPPNYDLFKGWMKSIPRISLSEGCLHNCAFCTIARGLHEHTYDEVYAQAMSFQGLEFELVYVNDKTYGQASNNLWLNSLFSVIREYNPAFQGFIVQTTVPMASMMLEAWIDMETIRYIEVGVEVVDSEYLKRMRKPYNLGQLKKLMNKIRRYDIGFIPNIIFGLPDHDYSSTLAWLWCNADQISFVNPYVLCQYEDSKGQMFEADGVNDANEHVMDKSWLSPKDVERTEAVMKQVFCMIGGD